MTATIVGKRMRELRHLLGMTVAQVAAAAHVNINTVQNIELGNNPAPSLPTLNAIARAIHTTVEQLVKEPRKKVS